MPLLWPIFLLPHKQQHVYWSVRCQLCCFNSSILRLPSMSVEQQRADDTGSFFCLSDHLLRHTCVTLVLRALADSLFGFLVRLFFCCGYVVIIKDLTCQCFKYSCAYLFSVTSLSGQGRANDKAKLWIVFCNTSNVKLGVTHISKSCSNYAHRRWNPFHFPCWHFQLAERSTFMECLVLPVADTSVGIAGFCKAFTGKNPM